MPPEHHIPRQPAATLCALGAIVNTHGVRGEVRLRPYNPDSHALQPGQTVTLRWPDRSASARIGGVRPHKQFRLLLLDGYESATAAETLIGAEVCVARDELPPLRPGEVYHADLIGLRVETTDGVELGVVDHVLMTGGNDVCVVRGPRREYLIPLIADVVRDLDVHGGRIVIDPIPGLLDL